jgi:hypothetical protein
VTFSDIQVTQTVDLLQLQQALGHGLAYDHAELRVEVVILVVGLDERLGQAEDAVHVEHEHALQVADGLLHCAQGTREQWQIKKRYVKLYQDITVC